MTGSSMVPELSSYTSSFVSMLQIESSLFPSTHSF